MTSDRLLLSWHQYESQIPDMFRGLWKEQDLADVTLSTMNNHHIRAHKVILSSASNLFKNIFQTNQSQNTLIYLKDINHKTLERIIEFIYMGQCEIDQTHLNDFLMTGKSLEVVGLVEKLRIETASSYKTFETNGSV